MSTASDVAILGGGIIGLSLAWELAQRGAQVTLFERDAPGHAASWAAGGMLAPYTEELTDPALRAFAIAALAKYPTFVEALQQASGIDVHWRLHGILEVAYDAVHAQRLKQRAEFLAAENVPSRLLHNDRDIAAYDPALARHAHVALLTEAEGQVDNRRLGRALTEAVERAGVTIRRHLSVESLVCNARRVQGVQTSLGFFAAATVINTLGSWAPTLGGVPEHLVAPVTPIKGQMLAVAMPHRYLQRVVWAAGVYLIPREDGRLLVGATVEQQGFDQRITAGGIHHLLHGLLQALPGASDFALNETWSGLRPQTPDGRPLLGRTELEGYVLATGHYRNGILLAPLTASVVADDLLGIKSIDTSFGLARFSKGGSFEKIAQSVT